MIKYYIRNTQGEYLRLAEHFVFDSQCIFVPNLNDATGFSAKFIAQNIAKLNNSEVITLKYGEYND